MIGTRLKEQCGKDKKFKTSKELAECIGISSNMFYLVSQNKRSISLKAFRSAVCSTGVSSNYYLGLTSRKEISVSDTNKKIPFKYELNLDLIKENSSNILGLIATLFKELESTNDNYDKKQSEFVDSLKSNNAIFNNERLKVIMEATGYTSESLANALKCSKSAVDGWLNKNTYPSIENFEKLVIILQCSGDFLLNITNDPNILWDSNENIINNQGISYDGTKIIYSQYGKYLKDF